MDYKIGRKYFFSKQNWAMKFNTGFEVQCAYLKLTSNIIARLSAVISEEIGKQNWKLKFIFRENWKTKIGNRYSFSEKIGKRKFENWKWLIRISFFKIRRKTTRVHALFAAKIHEAQGWITPIGVEEKKRTFWSEPILNVSVLDLHQLQCRKRKE